MKEFYQQKLEFPRPLQRGNENNLFLYAKQSPFLPSLPSPFAFPTLKFQPAHNGQFFLFNVQCWKSFWRFKARINAGAGWLLVIFSFARSIEILKLSWKIKELPEKCLKFSNSICHMAVDFNRNTFDLSLLLLHNIPKTELNLASIIVQLTTTYKTRSRLCWNKTNFQLNAFHEPNPLKINQLDVLKMFVIRLRLFGINVSIQMC
jgi:hypothetical protein